MSPFVYYRKVVALNSDVRRNPGFSFKEIDLGLVRDTTAAPIVGVGFAEPAPSENAQLH
jgi:hypothetical protein